jgi:hypothetical protein
MRRRRYHVVAIEGGAVRGAPVGIGLVSNTRRRW